MAVIRSIARRELRSYFATPLAYVFSVGVWARPLIANETTWRRRNDASVS